MQRSIWFILWISLIALSCSGPEKDQSSPDEPKPEQVAGVVTLCGSYLYPALFNLEVPLTDYKWPDVVIAQPAHSVSGLLGDTDKERIKEQFRDYLNSGNTPVQADRIRKWCTAATRFDQGAGNNLSTEEFLALLYNNDRYPQLFDPYRNRPLFATSGAEPIDKIASLSSAELTDLINRWFTLLSGLPNDEFETALISAGLPPAD